MHARVVTFEGGDAEQVRRTIGRSGSARERAAGGCPGRGLPAVAQPGREQGLGISLFATEDDLKQGDATLNAMDPPVRQGMGKRSSVEFYEVGVKADS